VSALQQWHDEVRDGKRSVTKFDELWAAASREQANLEFEAYLRPQREHLAQLHGGTVHARAEGRTPLPTSSTSRRSVFKPVRFGR